MDGLKTVFNPHSKKWEVLKWVARAKDWAWLGVIDEGESLVDWVSKYIHGLEEEARAIGCNPIDIGFYIGKGKELETIERLNSLIAEERADIEWRKLNPIN